MEERPEDGRWWVYYQGEWVLRDALPADPCAAFIGAYTNIKEVGRAKAAADAELGCEDCGEQGGLQYHIVEETQEPHHFTLELTLAAFCPECHMQNHLDMNGEFWECQADRDDHWWGYHREMDKD